MSELKKIDKQRLLALLNRGLSVKEIANDNDITEQYVYKLIKSYSIITLYV